MSIFASDKRWASVRWAAIGVAAYFVLEWVSEVHELMGLPVTAWNPGLGLAFAYMLRAPVAGIAVLFIGTLAVEVSLVDSALDWPIILLLAVLSALTYGGGAVAARRMNVNHTIASLRDMILLLAYGVGAAAVDAAMLTLLLSTVGTFAAADILGAAMPLFIGDVIGISVVMPLVLRLTAPDGFLGGKKWLNRHSLGAAIIGVSIVVLLWAILHGGKESALANLYILFLPVIAAALRYGLDGACLTLGFAQTVTIVLLRLFSFDPDAFAAVQAEMAVLVATALLTGAIVSERDTAARAARAARTALAERERQAIRADRLNLATAMTSALSHEINQPMTAARALARSAELRLTDTGAPADLERLRNNIRGVVLHIDHATEILARMRAFVERGAPDRQPTAVTAILADTLALIDRRARNENVLLAVEQEEGLPAIACEPVQIQQVLLNLIGNAIEAHAIAGQRAAPPPGHVVVRVSFDRDADRVIFSVRDDGPGIAPELAAHIFAPLVTEKPEGLGLGLPICALIIEAHGGRIWLESGAAGATEFRFWLPAVTTEETHAR